MTNEQVDESSGTPVETPKPSGHFGAAWVLIVLGSLLLLGNLFDIGGSVLLIVLGGAFLAGYFTTRNYGLLIPAMILIGLGVGVLLSDLDLFRLEDHWVSFCLGAGFAAIYLVDLATWRQGGKWPLWPGGFLVLIGVIGAGVETGLFDELWWGFVDIAEVWWPVLLILLGARMLRRRREPRSPEPAESSGAED